MKSLEALIAEILANLRIVVWRRITKRTTSLLLTGLVGGWLTPGLHGQTLEEGLADLASQISREMSEGHKQRIAVIEFSDLDGNVTDLGKFISEELTTRLFVTKKFQVVERLLLNKILKEHQLTLSGLIDENTARQVGKLLGVDAICSGTIADLVGSIRINARLISNETGSPFAVASAECDKNEMIGQLMRRVTPRMSQGTAEGVSERTTPASRTFFKEDFSNIQEGLYPAGWLGGDKLIVRSDNEKKYLTDFQRQGSHKVSVTRIAFPDDFELECTLYFGRGGSGTHVFMSVGAVTAVLDVAGWCELDQSKSERRENYADKVVRVILRKQGDVFRLFVNGEERIVARHLGFRSPADLSFEFRHMREFRLYEIVGKELGG
jgi:TolB-like protein